MSATEAVTEPRPSRIPVVRLLVAAAAVVGVVLLGRSLGDELPALAARIDGFGMWGPFAFIVAYAIATVAFVPGSILTLAAGAIFGIWRGTVIVFFGATIGAALAFLVARYMARAAIERRIEGHPRFAAIDGAVGDQGRKIVILLRLSPVFPFNMLNYALGLTRVRFVDYLIASLGMIPGTLLYVYYGRLAGDVAALASGMEVTKGAGYYTVLVIGLVATIVVTTLVTRAARQALRELTDDHPDV